MYLHVVTDHPQDDLAPTPCMSYQISSQFRVRNFNLFVNPKQPYFYTIFTVVPIYGLRFTSVYVTSSRYHPLHSRPTSLVVHDTRSLTLNLHTLGLIFLSFTNVGDRRRVSEWMTEARKRSSIPYLYYNRRVVFPLPSFLSFSVSFPVSDQDSGQNGELGTYWNSFNEDKT